MICVQLFFTKVLKITSLMDCFISEELVITHAIGKVEWTM